ncbi:hypothetical protein KY319_01150 [Candidatus Woesearchaeota archaeon]|nr:hypothetical protein [Candidatus Woesearchaeota archaeon]
MKKRHLFLAVFLMLITSVTAYNVEVGTYLVNLDRFDEYTGTFLVDFWLTLKCDYNCSIDEFVFVNGADMKHRLAYQDENIKSYIVEASLSTPINMQKYPFDKQRLFFIIEHGQLPTSKLRMSPLKEYTAVDTRVNLPGWQIGNHSSEVVNHYYQGWNDYWASYVFEVEVIRPKLDGFIKNILPILFLALILMFTYILDVNRLDLRLGITGSIIVALVVMNLTLTDQMPSFGYTTFIDKFILLTYGIALAAFFTNITLIHLQHERKNKFVNKLNNALRYALPLLIIAAYALLFYFFI